MREARRGAVVGGTWGEFKGVSLRDRIVIVAPGLLTGSLFMAMACDGSLGHGVGPRKFITELEIYNNYVKFIDCLWTHCKLASTMKSHGEVIRSLMQRSRVRDEVQRIEREETELLDALLRARHEAGLTQAQLAELMGTQSPAIARLERSLATGKHSPSIATLRRYLNACGKKLVLSVN